MVETYKVFYKLSVTTQDHKRGTLGERGRSQSGVVCRGAARHSGRQSKGSADENIRKSLSTSWISDEGKYVRETLRTKDLETAIKRGEERVFQLFSDIHSGRKIFGITLRELVRMYLEWRRSDDVETGNITRGRLGTISAHLKHFLEYKGDDTKISDLDGQSCFDYAEFRRKNYPEVRDVTIRNEEASINHLIKYAYRNGYAHFVAFEFRKTRIRSEEVGRRDTFTLEEYDKLVLFLRKWTSKGALSDEAERARRLLIRDAILIASNTMLRVGELWQLRWGDVVGYETSADETGHAVALVTLSVRAETAENRRSRLITCRGGEYFQRLYERVSDSPHRLRDGVAIAMRNKGASLL